MGTRGRDWNPKKVGEISESQVLAALLKAGKTVLVPFGDNQRYDLVIDEGNGQFVRVQVKTGRYYGGCVVANGYSTNGRHSTVKRRYVGDADVFAVYCPDNGKIYLVPVGDLDEIRLRVDATRNRQVKGVRWAAEFELG